MLSWILQQLYLCREFFIRMFSLRRLKNEQMEADLTFSDVEVFRPEQHETDAEDENEYEYRFLCPHAGRFISTSPDLIFDMDEKGEVLCRIEYWEERALRGLGRTNPAGHWYNIYCHEGSISRLHLPHCHIHIDVVEFTAALITGGKVKIIQPLKVTNTHVIIDLHGLSLFGLVIGLRYQNRYIKHLVLRLCEEITGKEFLLKTPPLQ